MDQDPPLPPGQQLVAADRWPLVGEREPAESSLPWTVTVEGCVTRPQTWSLDELRGFPQVEQVVDIHCVTRWSLLGAPFLGIPLAALLAEAGADDRARFVSFVARSVRSHSTSLPLADALALRSLVALEHQGHPLQTEHGGPVRMVVPGRYFYKSVKWLTRIVLLAEDRLGHWEATAGYHNTADPWREERYIAAGLSKQRAAKLIAARDFSGLELLSLAAGGCDLRGLAAQRALLRNADFRQSDLREARFDGTNLTNAHFQGADLRGASLAGADCEGVNFAGADLRGADLRGASLFGASFRRETPAGADAMVDHTTLIHLAALEALTPVEAEFVKSALSS